MSRVQTMLDEMLLSRQFKSVLDMQFIECDSNIYIQRKLGRRSILVDVSRDKDEEAIREHLESLPVFY